MVHDIVEKYRHSLSVNYNPDNRVKVINDMKAEIALMKETWAVISPETKFEDVVTK